jgi:drug/metabolite transporter (DMT)-like permease
MHCRNNKLVNTNVLELLMGVIAISFLPLAVKWVVFTPAVSAFYRSFYAGLFLFIWAVLRYKSEFTFGNIRWLLPCTVGGIAFAIDLIIWHKSIVYLGAGPATFIGNTQIIFVVLYAAFVFKEKIPKIFYLFLAIIAFGMYLLLPQSPSIISKPTGYIYGLIVGATYAVMLISMRYAKSVSGEKYPELLSLSSIFFIGAVVIAGYIVIMEPSTFRLLEYKSHLIMASTAFVCQTVGWYFIKINITKIPAYEGSLLLILQPLLATVWGIIIFKEALSGIQIFGIFLASAGIIIYQMKFGNTCLPE